MRLPRHPDPVDLSDMQRLPYLFVLRELEEAGNEDAGLALWQTLRNVRMRLDAPAHPAARLLAEHGGRLADAVPELRATLHGMDRLLRDYTPDEETHDGLVAGCTALALWAEGEGACATALTFFQLAAELDRDRPDLCYHVGRLARKLAKYEDAEAWLRWAYRLARVRREWEVAALCLSGLGNLYRQKGNLPLARRYHELCLRASRRHDLRTIQGDALYDLAGISFNSGRCDEAHGFVRDALLTYGPAHSRIPRLAKDVAWVWMDKYGLFEQAAAVFLELLDHIWEPAPRLLLFASLARATAGAAWMDMYEKAWNETWALMRQQPVREGHAGALVQLALGAGNLMQWDRVRVAAGEALRVARERKEGEAVLVAEALLEAAAPGLSAEAKPIPIPRDKDAAADATLAVQLTGALRARRDDAPVALTSALVVEISGG